MKADSYTDTEPEVELDFGESYFNRSASAQYRENRHYESPSIVRDLRFWSTISGSFRDSNDPPAETQNYNQGDDGRRSSDSRSLYIGWEMNRKSYSQSEWFYSINPKLYYNFDESQSDGYAGSSGNGPYPSSSLNLLASGPKLPSDY